MAGYVANELDSSAYGCVRMPDYLIQVEFSCVPITRGVKSVHSGRSAKRPSTVRGVVAGVGVSVQDRYRRGQNRRKGKASGTGPCVGNYLEGAGWTDHDDGVLSGYIHIWSESGIGRGGG
jgi:hypothetical protein